jgi:hypothetical protein
MGSQDQRGKPSCLPEVVGEGANLLPDPGARKMSILDHNHPGAPLQSLLGEHAGESKPARRDRVNRPDAEGIADELQESDRG